MRETRSSGSVRGASGDGRPYRAREPAVDVVFRRRTGVASMVPVGNGGSTVETRPSPSTRSASGGYVSVLMGSGGSCPTPDPRRPIAYRPGSGWDHATHHTEHHGK